MGRLTREELERELVMFDKQTVITQCLKLFDTNTNLVLQIEAYQNRIKEMEEMVEGLVAKNKELKQRTWFQMLRKRIGL
jgi:hypothetical protein